MNKRTLEMVLHNLLYTRGYNFQERFVKGLWKSLWTTSNSRCTTSGPPGPRWESLFHTTLFLLWKITKHSKN